MLDGAASGVGLCQDRAALCVHHILGYGINDGLAGKVDALNLVSVVLGSGTESGCQAKARMQPFATQGKTVVQCVLL